jgi:hypothetical protein
MSDRVRITFDPPAETVKAYNARDLEVEGRHVRTQSPAQVVARSMQNVLVFCWDRDQPPQMDEVRNAG